MSQSTYIHVKMKCKPFKECMIQSAFFLGRNKLFCLSSLHLDFHLFCFTEEVMLAEENKNSGTSALEGKMGHCFVGFLVTQPHKAFNISVHNVQLKICFWREQADLFLVSCTCSSQKSND